MQTQVPQFAINFVRSLPVSQRIAYAKLIERTAMDTLCDLDRLDWEADSRVAWRDAVEIARDAWRAGVRIAWRKDGSLRAL